MTLRGDVTIAMAGLYENRKNRFREQGSFLLILWVSTRPYLEAKHLCFIRISYRNTRLQMQTSSLQSASISVERPIISLRRTDRFSTRFALPSRRIMLRPTVDSHHEPAPTYTGAKNRNPRGGRRILRQASHKIRGQRATEPAHGGQHFVSFPSNLMRSIASSIARRRLIQLPSMSDRPAGSMPRLPP